MSQTTIWYRVLFSLALWVITGLALLPTETKSCRSLYEEKPCTKKCCGSGVHAICSDSCVGYFCARDSDCADGCCQEGKCISSNCLPVSLIIGAAVTIFTAILLLVVVVWCWSRRRKHSQSFNVNLEGAPPLPSDVNLPYTFQKCCDTTHHVVAASTIYVKPSECEVHSAKNANGMSTVSRVVQEPRLPETRGSGHD